MRMTNNASFTERMKTLVKFIGADGRGAITADVEQMTTKDEMTARLKLTQFNQHRHRLIDAIGKSF